MDDPLAAVLRSGARHARVAWRGAGSQVVARRRYLGAWRALDGRLLAQADPRRRLICFGTGEAVRLLRTYARRVGPP